MGPVVNFCFLYCDTETELILTDSRTGVSSAVPDLRFVEGHQISSQYHLGFSNIQCTGFQPITMQHGKAVYFIGLTFCTGKSEKLQWSWLKCLIPSQISNGIPCWCRYPILSSKKPLVPKRPIITIFLLPQHGKNFFNKISRHILCIELINLQKIIVAQVFF